MDYADCPDCAGGDFRGLKCDFHEIKYLKTQRFWLVIFLIAGFVFYLLSLAFGSTYKPVAPKVLDQYTVEHSGGSWVITDAKGERI